MTKCANDMPPYGWCSVNRVREKTRLERWSVKVQQDWSVYMTKCTVIELLKWHGNYNCSPLLHIVKSYESASLSLCFTIDKLSLAANCIDEKRNGKVGVKKKIK